MSSNLGSPFIIVPIVELLSVVKDAIVTPYDKRDKRHVFAAKGSIADEPPVT